MIYFMNQNSETLPFPSHIGREITGEWRVVDSCQADGHELVRCAEILCQPVPKERVFTYVGDEARRIAANWR